MIFRIAVVFIWFLNAFAYAAKPIDLEITKYLRGLSMTSRMPSVETIVSAKGESFTQDVSFIKRLMKPKLVVRRGVRKMRIDAFLADPSDSGAVGRQRMRLEASLDKLKTYAANKKLDEYIESTFAVLDELPSHYLAESLLGEFGEADPSRLQSRLKSQITLNQNLFKLVFIRFFRDRNVLQAKTDFNRLFNDIRLGRASYQLMVNQLAGDLILAIQSEEIPLEKVDQGEIPFPNRTYDDSKVHLTEQEIECGICQDSEVVRLECDHEFHSGCLGQHAMYHNTCPTCEKEFPTKTREETFTASSIGHREANEEEI